MLFSFCAFPQTIDTKFYTSNDGLFSNNVSKTYIDSKGVLWIGSRAGLAKKTTGGFERVEQGLKHKFNNIFDITEDSQQGMWIAGYGRGLLYIKGNKTKLIQKSDGLLSNEVRNVKNFGNKMYVGTSKGLSIISIEDFSIITPEFKKNPNHDFTITSDFEANENLYVTVINDGIYKITDSELILVSPIKRVFSSFVFQGKIYIGTETELLVLNDQTFEIEKKYPIGCIWDFCLVDNSLYFVSSGVYESFGGIYQLENQKVTKINDTLNIPFDDLKSLAYQPKLSLLFFGSFNNGLIQVNRTSPVRNAFQLPGTSVLTFCENQTYIFHKQGLSIISGDKIIHTVSLEKFKDLQEKKEHIFKKLAQKENHFYPIDYQTPANKIKFYQAKVQDQRLWVATNIGMFVLDIQGNILDYLPIHVFNFTFFKDQLITAVPYGGVRIFQDVFKMKYSYFHDYEKPNIPSEIVDIVKTDDAVYFASALYGIYQYKDGVFTSFLENQWFNEAKIKRICTTKEEHLVVVTDFNDVYILDVSHPKVKILRHIPHDKIKGSSTNFVNDMEGVLYVGTNLGINILKENRYFFIDRAQGFTDYNSTMATPYNNSLYIGTKQGFFEVQNDYFNQTEVSADEAVISEILVNNRSFPKITVNSIPPELKLNYNQNNIRLLFSVPNAKYPDKIKFKYRLKSTEPWQELMDENLLSLNYLNDGDYEVALQIANEDTGNISVQYLLKLTIKPPFYYTRGFILACSLIIIAGSWVAYKRRIRYLKKNQERELALAALQSEQEKKELLFEKQLADVKLQALKSQMNSHFLFNVLGSIQYFILCKDVDNALYYLERFSQLIRTTLDYSDQKTISLYEEIAYLKQYIEIENLRAENTIVFKEIIADDLDSTEIKITPLLLQPFVENAIIHAFPPSVLKPEIKLKIEKEDQSIKITITDNGIGYQQKTRTVHHSKGISIAENRLGLTQKNLQKPIEITTSSNGTQVVIFID